MAVQYLIDGEAFGRNLKKLRKRSGLRQSDVAAQLQILESNMSESTYSHIESGRRNIKLSDLILLKRVLKATYEEMLEGEGL